MSNDPREIFIEIKQYVVGNEIISSQINTSPKSNKHISSFIQPPNEDGEIDGDNLPLKWSMQKQRGSKGKEKVYETIKVIKTYSTRSSERKLMGDALKASKFTTIKRRRLRQKTVIDE